MPTTKSTLRGAGTMPARRWLLRGLGRVLCFLNRDWDTRPSSKVQTCRGAVVILGATRTAPGASRLRDGVAEDGGGGGGGGAILYHSTAAVLQRGTPRRLEMEGSGPAAPSKGAGRLTKDARGRVALDAVPAGSVGSGDGEDGRGW